MKERTLRRLEENDQSDAILRILQEPKKKRKNGKIRTGGYQRNSNELEGDEIV